MASCFPRSIHYSKISSLTAGSSDLYILSEDCIHSHTDICTCFRHQVTGESYGWLAGSVMHFFKQWIFHLGKFCVTFSLGMFSFIVASPQ